MYVRSAFFEGSLDDAQLATFREHMTDVVAPIVATFPGVRRYDLFWPDMLEAGAPALVLNMAHFYDDAAAMEAALASPQRADSVRATGAILERLPLKVWHINYHHASIGVRSGNDQ